MAKSAWRHSEESSSGARGPRSTHRGACRPRPHHPRAATHPAWAVALLVPHLAGAARPPSRVSVTLRPRDTARSKPDPLRARAPAGRIRSFGSSSLFLSTLPQAVLPTTPLNMRCVRASASSCSLSCAASPASMQRARLVDHARAPCRSRRGRSRCRPPPARPAGTASRSRRSGARPPAWPARSPRRCAARPRSRRDCSIIVVDLVARQAARSGHGDRLLLAGLEVLARAR